jgi:hypothetical protein
MLKLNSKTSWLLASIGNLKRGDQIMQRPYYIMPIRAYTRKNLAAQ